MKKDLKIGLLLRSFKNLNSWELRIINEIKNHPNLNISLIIQDGRKKNNFDILKSKYIIRKFFYKIQFLIERLIFKKPNFNKNLKAMHHLHQGNDFYVFDAAFKNII